jgi:hypothetical protein
MTDEEKMKLDTMAMILHAAHRVLDQWDEEVQKWDDESESWTALCDAERNTPRTPMGEDYNGISVDAIRWDLIRLASALQKKAT